MTTLIDWEARARNTFKHHVAHRLCLTDEVEVWRFKAPSTIDCAFDIMITAYGMAMVGDFGNLTFNVGSSYGIKFLMHRSKGYVIEKLDEDCRKYVLHEESFKEYVFSELKEHFHNTYEDDAVLHKYLDNAEDFDSLVDQLTEYEQNEDTTVAGLSDNDYCGFLHSATYVENLDQAYALLYEQSWIDEVCHHSFSALTDFVHSRIWALHIAAEQIMGIEHGDKK